MTRRIAGILLATGLGLALPVPALTAVAQADPSATPVTPTTPAPTIAVAGGVQAPTSGASTSGATQTAAASPTSGTVTAAAGTDVLDQLAEEYAVGSGGGQMSNLLKAALKLKAMGFRPSKANLEEISQAMAYRPNQMPLISALKDTIAYQQKLKAQMEILQQYQQAQAGNAVLGGSTYSGPAMGAPSAGAPAMGQPGTSAGTVPGGAPMMPAAPTP